jgi:death-on-curing family protein
MAKAATKTYRFLTTSQIQRLHRLYVSPNDPTQPGLLDSAAKGPINAKYYGSQDNVFQLAANLSDKIMKNHPFQDGIKRTAMAAADMFLRINGYKLQEAPFDPSEPNNQGFRDAHLALTNNQLTAEQLGNYYQSTAQPVTTWTTLITEYKNAAQEY